MLIRGVCGHSAWTPGTAALTVSWLASIGAAVALHLLGTSLYGRRAGWALVAICCSAPVSVVLSMAYSERLFLALVAGMLVAAHRQVWWAAGLLGLAAALTRPTGAAAALALAVAALLALRDARRSEAWQPLGAAAVALAGVPRVPRPGSACGSATRGLVPDPGGRLGHLVRLRQQHRRRSSTTR